MKYIALFIFLVGCDWMYQEKVAEDVVETIIKDETGVDLKAPHERSHPSVELIK